MGASTPQRIVAVTGLAREARIASGPGVRAIACGGDPRRLALALERELASGVCGVISFGIAGGLAEDLRSGTCLVGRAIVVEGVRWPCDAAWSRALAERLPGAIAADLAGVDAMVMAPSAKRALRRETQAAAVDNESHIAAALAARRGLPFAALRVVADTAWRTLPEAASVALTPGGRINGTAVALSLGRAPAQLPSLLRTAVDAHAALRALSRARRLLGPGLAYPDLGELLLDVS